MLTQEQKDLLEQKIVPTITIEDKISKEVATIKVYENLISIEIGNRIVNLSSEQGIAAVMSIGDQIKMFKDLRLMETQEQLNKTKLDEIKKLHLFYSHEPEEEVILIDDEIEIISSEFCVTNADTIKYDEKISAQKGIVKGIDLLKKEVLVEIDNQKIIVHSHWLTFLSRKTPSNSPEGGESK